MTTCICQKAYDTGFTGIPKIDARLQYHYEHWLDPDCIKRSYDHYAFGIPYVESTARRPYCFEQRRPMLCDHEACEHGRYRPPETVAKMRFYIERNCPAAIHYPDLNERLDRAGDTRPEMDNTAHLSEQWEALQYRLHKSLGFRDREPRLKALPLADFLEEVECVVWGWGDEDLWFELPPQLQHTLESNRRYEEIVESIVTVTSEFELAAAVAARETDDAFDALIESLDHDAVAA